MATFRDELIRAVFEARRDVRWWKTVEPNLRDNGFDAHEIDTCRLLWNEKREQNEWATWQKEAQRYSNAVLDDMRMDCIDRLDAIGCLQLVRDKAAAERETFRQVLAGKSGQQETPLEQLKKLGREM